MYSLVEYMIKSGKIFKEKWISTIKYYIYQYQYVIMTKYFIYISL